MSFRERFINTLALIGYKFYRDYSQLPKYESMIDQHFPDDPRSNRPSLADLEYTAGLTLTGGNPMVMYLKLV